MKRMSVDTKTALLNSAKKATRGRGIDGFSYGGLAQNAGIRKASIHHHFPTKATLAAALMTRYTNNINDACDAIDARFARGGARLSALIDWYANALEDDKTLCLCASFSAGRESLSGRLSSTSASSA